MNTDRKLSDAMPTASYEPRTALPCVAVPIGISIRGRHHQPNEIQQALILELSSKKPQDRNPAAIENATLNPKP